MAFAKCKNNASVSNPPMSSPTNILAFDCAMGGCSAALMKDGTLVGHKVIEGRNQQTHALLPMIERLMQQHGLDFNQLDAIATTSGPGSFTGIRIGLATAQALTYAARCPLYAITTLELLAWQAYRCAPQNTLPLVTLINAYRGEVYAQSFTHDGTLSANSEPQLLPQSQLTTFLPENTPFILAGDAASVLDALNLPHSPVADDATSPSAVALADYIATQPPAPIARGALSAFYLRAPDAKPQKPLTAPN